MNNEFKNFVDKVELIDVFLKSQGSQSFDLPRQVDPSKVNLDFDFKARFERLENNLFISYIAVSVCAKATKSKSDKKFEIMVEYALVYNSEDYKEEITDKLLLDFSRRTALFSAYPYLRESIQSLSCKMGVPPIVAPLLKFNRAQGDEGQKVAESTPKKVQISKKAKKKK